MKVRPIWFLWAVLLTFSTTMSAEQGLSVELKVSDGTSMAAASASKVKATKGSYRYQLAATPGSECNTQVEQWPTGQPAQKKVLLSYDMSSVPSNFTHPPIQEGNSFYPALGYTTGIYAKCTLNGQTKISEVLIER